MRQVNTMANSDQLDTTVRGTVTLTPAMRAALRLWTSAPGYGDAGADPWAAVITIEQLLGVGLTQCDLRWLVSKGYVRHACEIIEPGQVVRLFRPGRNLAFTNQTRFLLTAAGAALVQGEDLAAPLVETSVADHDEAEGHVLQLPTLANRQTIVRRAA
jgi:hypothetical protein